MDTTLHSQARSITDGQLRLIRRLLQRWAYPPARQHSATAEDWPDTIPVAWSYNHGHGHGHGTDPHRVAEHSDQGGDSNARTRRGD